MRRRAASPWLLSGLLGGASVLHFVTPDSYAAIVPRALGDPRAWVFGSGVVELVCAVAVALPASRRRGALVSAALFVAVFPANLQMALDADASKPGLANNPFLAYGRLPLQVPLVLWALAVARAAARADAPAPAPRAGDGRIRTHSGIGGV